MAKFILVFFGTFLPLYGSAQQRISGYVEDSETGERLPGANVWLSSTGHGTSTNYFGFFSLSATPRDSLLSVSFVGYQTAEINLKDSGDRQLLVRLHPLELDEHTVYGMAEGALERQPQVSAITLPIRQLMRLPAVGGETDIMRGLQLLPGVQSGREGMTGLYVRGGGPDQNLILLDGMPLYNVSHLGGIFSVFNPDIISDVQLLRGGFPARHGGRLSSVVQIKVREGNRNAPQTKGAIGLASARLSHEGPLKEGRGSYLLGVRRSYIDAFTRPISKLSSGGATSFGYTFYDLNGKINTDLTSKDKVFASVYSGHDRAIVHSGGNSDVSASNLFMWGNFLATARWNRVVSDRVFSNLTAGYTRYAYQIGFEQEERDTENAHLFQYNSGIEDLSLRYDWEFYLHRNYTLRSGMQFIEHFFTPGVNLFRSTQEQVRTDTSFGSFNVRSREVSLYAENEWEPTDRFATNLGVHLNAYFVNGERFFSPQPRATFRYLLKGNSSIKASYAAMQQNVHLLSSTGVGFPTDLWVPATDRTVPQRSDQLTAAFHKRLPRGLELTVEGYYKTMRNLIAYSEGVNWLEGAEDWQEKVEGGGKGLSRGLEVLLHRKEGRLNGWIGYTLAKTDLTFAGINGGRSFPDRYDRRHDLSLFLTYKLKEHVSLSGTWVYGTGNAITLGEARYVGISNGVPDLNDPRIGFNRHAEYFSGRNNFRMRAYHRADLGVRFSKEKKWGERTWNIGVYNLYSRANPFYYYWGNQMTFFASPTTDRRTLRQIALFPIIPAISYEFTF